MTTTLLKTATCWLALSLLLGAQAQADGMVPDTSVVIIYEAEGEAAVSVTNTDGQLALLHVTLEDIPEDTEPLLVVTPPLSRVEPDKSQLVRFILQSQQPLRTQRLKRAIFEGMPQGRSAAKAGHALDQPDLVATGQYLARAQRQPVCGAPGPGPAPAAR